MMTDVKIILVNKLSLEKKDYMTYSHALKGMVSRD